MINVKETNDLKIKENETYKKQIEEISLGINKLTENSENPVKTEIFLEQHNFFKQRSKLVKFNIGF